jgi:twitching motility protein PilT
VLSSLHTTDAAGTLQRILSYYPEHARHQVCMDLSLCLQGVVAQRLVPRASGEGRVAAVEVLVASPAVRRLLRDQRIDEVEDLMSTAGDGMQTFNRALVGLYEKGLVSLEVGAAYATNPDEFRLSAHGVERGVSAFVADQDALPTNGAVDMRTLLAIAMRYGASDIHLVVNVPPIFRINGRLRRLETDALTPADVRRMLFSLLSLSQRERFELDRRRPRQFNAVCHACGGVDRRPALLASCAQPSHPAGRAECPRRSPRGRAGLPSQQPADPASPRR